MEPSTAGGARCTTSGPKERIAAVRVRRAGSEGEVPVEGQGYVGQTNDGEPRVGRGASAAGGHDQCLVAAGGELLGHSAHGVGHPVDLGEEGLGDDRDTQRSAGMGECERAGWCGGHR